MLLACSLLLLQDPHALADIEKRLRAAVDKSSYESSEAYAAAQELASLRSPEAMRLRLELFDDKLDTYRGVYLRDWFYSGMQRAASFEEAELLAQAAADRKRSELLRLLCLRALAACGARVPSRPLLEKSFDKAPPRLQREWQRTLGIVFGSGRLEGATKEESLNLAETVRKRLQDAGPPYLGLASLPVRDDQIWGLLLQTALEAKDLGDRAEALRCVHGGAWLPVLRAALSTPHCGVRTAALESAVAAGDPLAVELILEAMQVEAAGERGRFLGDCARGLQALTGQQFGANPQLWERWWREQGPSYVAAARSGAYPGDRPRTIGEAETRAADDDTTVARIFDLPVDSKRVAIVVDGSGSMRMGRLGETTCAEAAANEVEKYLGQLPEEARFNLYLISDRPVPLFKKLTPCGRKARADAVDMLRRYDFGGTSALYDVLIAVQNEPEVDTIVLIGDGGGSSGSHQYAGHMLAGLEREYLRTGVRIHGICVGSDAPKIKFMQDVAAATGGRCVQL